MKAVMTGCVLLAAICSPSANAQVNAQVETGSATLYGAGVFSTGSYELAPSFTPDGKRGYFTVSTPAYGRLHVILETVYDGKRWSTPKIAAFSGQYGDADPLISPDGSRLFFLSRRPAPGRAADRQDFDVWFVERVGNGWGEPRHVPEASGPNEEHYASVAADGTLYVSAVRSDSKGRGDIYRVPLINGRYGEPENLGPAINSADHHDTTAYIAPDQSYMIFSSFGRPEGGGADLYISFRRNGVWTEARNIGPLVNSRRTEYCPTVSHDGKYLYFTSERGFADSALQQRATTEHWNRLISSPGNGLGDTYRVAMKDVWAALNIPAASRPSSVSTPTSSQISLRFDYSGVEPLIEALGRDSIGDAKVDSLLAIPSIRAMVDNVIRFIPSVKVSDFGDAVKDFARTKQPATAQTPGRLFQFHSVWAGRDQVRELLKRIQANEADVIRSTLSELSAYAPNSGPITITIYFIAGGVSDGFMFEAKEHAFYANLTRANGDYNNALSNISHESYHVLQHAASSVIPRS